jgi:hypothetical protein
MKCDEIVMLLNPLIDGELSEELEAAVQRHLLRCATCAHDKHGLEQVRLMLREAVECAEPNAAFIERTEALLRDRLDTHVKPPARDILGGQWTLPFGKGE